MSRRCFYTSKTFARQSFGKTIYQLVTITEGQAGYHVYSEGPDLDMLKQMADISNQSPAMTNQAGGLTPTDVQDIVRRAGIEPATC